MASFLLTWNPNNFSGWRGDELESIKEDLSNLETVTTNWSTGLSKRLRPGDRVYWLRLGLEPRGIFATGRVVSETYEAPHWDPDRADAGQTQRYVDAEIDELLDPWSEPIPSREQLQRDLPEVYWSPQAGGVEVQGDAELKLAMLWHEFMARSGAGPLPPVGNILGIRRNVESFIQALEERPDDFVELLVQSTYFVYDPASDVFVPNKWCAFRGMTGETYLALRKLQSEERDKRGFDGGRASRIVEGVLGAKYDEDPDLSPKLASLYSSLSAAPTSRDWSSARFITLPLPAGIMPNTNTPDLNVIYYGPPGTGKTYMTAQRALEIIDGSAAEDRRES